MKKQILLFVLTLLPMLASASPVEINGIYYNLIPKGKVAEVTRNPNAYSGEVVIPASVTYEEVEYSVASIGNYAFKYETGLTSVTIPNSVIIIGDGAFEECSGLTSATIPNSVTSMGDAAFYRCSGLTSVTIGNSVTSIGVCTFYECSCLTSITIGNSVTSIGGQAFRGCSGLTSVTIPSSVKSIGVEAFCWCSGLTSVTIPNSVTSIGVLAFSGCRSLTSLTIPNSVTSIGKYAFQGCSGLASITIGSGIQSIGDRAFADCPGLSDVYCFAENVPNTDIGAFFGSYPEYATLHVPNASLQAYKDTNPWSQFGTIKTLEGDTPGAPKCATPTISYIDKELLFVCETEGVEFVSEIKVADNGMFYDDRITLSATYEISVYATKAGYENSDVATATLVWADASFTETSTTTAIAPAAKMEAPVPVLIQNNGDTLSILGAQDGTPISVFTVAGMQAATAISQNSHATISTNMQQGDIAIIKIGEKTIKVVIK